MKYWVIFSILVTTLFGGMCSGAIIYGQDYVASVSNKSGCCSRHGGVSYCGKSGYYVCADGTTSPSCRCR